MKLGLCSFPTDYGIAPDALAAAAEERGFESLFFCEHTHIPVSRRTPYPAGGELPRMYLHSLDLFGALTAAAVVTGNLRIGSGVWVGGGAIILPGVTVGDGAIVGAGSVVTRDVAPGMTVVGNPARRVNSGLLKREAT